jgi:hypothetical protein
MRFRMSRGSSSLSKSRRVLGGKARPLAIATAQRIRKLRKASKLSLENAEIAETVRKRFAMVHVFHLPQR